MKRTPLKRKTPLKPGKPKPGRVTKPGPSGSGRRTADPGFPEPVRLAVRRRSGGRCEVQSRVCTGKAVHLHHRKLRRHKDHSEANALHACRACHDHIHANPSKAYLMGWLVHEWLDPADVPVKRGATS